ncbi:MAG: hypothetical protein IPI73_25700 [Betaproteobacteria bacterium]|nr:hypothetical protein [Betaproteobacteria bacterium]
MGVASVPCRPRDDDQRVRLGGVEHDRLAPVQDVPVGDGRRHGGRAYVVQVATAAGLGRGERKTSAAGDQHLEPRPAPGPGGETREQLTGDHRRGQVAGDEQRAAERLHQEHILHRAA